MDSPERFGHLVVALNQALHPGYVEAVKCYGGEAPSDLEYSLQVRSSGLQATLVAARFVQIKTGAVVSAAVIECVTRALNRPATVIAEPQKDFPADVEGEIHVPILLGP